MGLKKNIAYSSLLTVANYIFPFLTFPYVTRVLGVENFGMCNFYNSIVSYFLLFSMMGMSTLAVREIAKCKGDKNELNKTYSSLFVLNGITTIISIGILLLSIFFVSKFQEHPQFIIIGAIHVLSNYFLLEWLFRGLEDFKYITLRSIIIRTLYVFLVFVFVKKTDDYLIYFLLTSLMVTANALVNITYSRRFVRFSFKIIEIRKYIKPYIIFGAYQLLTSMYTSFNVAYLGFSCGDVEVGYYSTSVKIFNILLSFYTAFTGVLLPRMSQMIEADDIVGFQSLLRKSLNLLFSIAIPIIIFTEFYTEEIITIISGAGYIGAVVPMKLVMPLVLIIGIEQVLVYQVLMPLKKDKQVFINSCLGAFIGVLLNIILVPNMKAVGSAVVWLSSEIIVLSSAYYFVRKYIKIANNIWPVIFRKNIFYIPLILMLLIVEKFTGNFSSMLIGGTLSVLYWILIEFSIDKDSAINIIFYKYRK